MNTQFYNIIDEKGRFVRLKAVLVDERVGPSGQYDSHTLSYLYCREMEREYHPKPFGLEGMIEHEAKIHR